MEGHCPGRGQSLVMKTIICLLFTFSACNLQENTTGDDNLTDKLETTWENLHLESLSQTPTTEFDWGIGNVNDSEVVNCIGTCNGASEETGRSMKLTANLHTRNEPHTDKNETSGNKFESTNTAEIYADALQYVSLFRENGSENMSSPKNAVVVQQDPAPALLIAEPAGSFSCLAHCGKEYKTTLAYVCSCDAMCMVFNSCCPDFKLICPTVYKEAEGHLSQLKDQAQNMRCSIEHRIWIVSKCPGELDATSSPPLQGNGSRQAFEPLEEFDLRKIASGKPITDLSTGIPYINKRVFDCYATSQSIPREWQTQSALVSALNVPSTLGDLSVTVDVSDNLFTSPVFTRGCYHAVVSECPPGENSLSSNLSVLCETDPTLYVSEVTKNSSVSWKIYRNVHCALCNLGNRSIVLTVVHVSDGLKDNALRVLMNLNSAGKLVLESNTRMAPMWRRIECDVSSDQGNCELISCKHTYSDPVYKCLTKRKMSARIEDLETRTKEELDQLRLDTMCYLHQYFNFLIAVNESEVVQRVEHRQVYYYAFSIIFYYDGPELTLAGNELTEFLGQNLYTYSMPKDKGEAAVDKDGGIGTG